MTNMSRMMPFNRSFQCGLTMIACGLAIASHGSAYGEKTATLKWDKSTGVVVESSVATVHMDRNGTLPAPELRIGGGVVELDHPEVTSLNPERLTLTYHAKTPDGNTLKLVRELNLAFREGCAELTEEFRITPDQPITADLEIRRPFTLLAATGSSKASAICPLFNGWAKPYLLSGTPAEVEYWLGSVLSGKGVDRLALPVIQLEQPGVWRAALSSDCRFSTLFNVCAPEGQNVQGVVRYRYACSQVPLKGTETRKFGLWLTPPPPADEPFGSSIDSFFQLMLPEVPPGPPWLHHIAMVYYDFLSENGEGWENDVNELARLLKPEERGRVALCFHGWYESLGGYGYDNTTGKMKTEWIAMERTRKVPLSEVEMKRRLRLAKELGFRVLLYYGDGLNQDSGFPAAGCYHADWDYLDAQGKRIRGWKGPDTWGATYRRNPSHPEVVAWYSHYLKALLRAFGSEIDGFVWDETFLIRQGWIARKPEPAYCDRAMLDLIKRLREQVKAVDPEKVFLVSDCIAPDEFGWGGNVNYAMMADGTFQDSRYKPDCWSYAFFPNWRNTYWSCNWRPENHFFWMRWGVETFGTPVAISNGYGDDRGPSEWNPKFRHAVLDLFHKRLKMTPTRFLTENPNILLAHSPEMPPPSDPIPIPEADEVNWALASNGAKATASSHGNGTKNSPEGVIDGIRDDANWLNGHGWCSDPHPHPLPQWVEVSFPQPKSISRFVLITYSEKGNPSSVNTWGVKNYDIEFWDPSSKSWNLAVSEKKDRVLPTRVHTLERPIQTSRVRVVVREVAPFDEIVRLLQVEAWGRGNTRGRDPLTDREGR